MQKTINLIITALLCVTIFTACNGNEAPSDNAPVSSEPASAALSSTAPSSTEPSSQPEEEYYSHDFDLTNDTGVAIHELYVSPTDEDNWGENLMGQGVIKHGVTLRFSSYLVGNAYAQ